MEAYTVLVLQNNNAVNNMVEFVFNKLEDALQFAETCLECGNKGTLITVREKGED